MSRHDLGWLRHPIVVWLLHVTTVWLWHAAGPYDAAVRNQPLHVLEHLSFVITGLLFWHTVIGLRGSAHRVSPGLGILLIFGTAMQGVLLAALLTFARTPWYESYAASAPAWGLQPLADQQLAGVIMWMPGTPVYLVMALWLAVAWLRRTEREAATS